MNEVLSVRAKHEDVKQTTLGSGDLANRGRGEGVHHLTDDRKCRCARNARREIVMGEKPSTSSGGALRSLY